MSPSLTRFFSLPEANALVPTLQARFGRARELREELGNLQSQLAEAGHPMDRPEAPVDSRAPAPVQRLQRAAGSILDELRSLIQDVSDLGIEVKAADGLVDFRTRLRGRTVYLCWRYGEDQITTYHELDAGFEGRKALPVAGDFVGEPLH